MGDADTYVRLEISCVALLVTRGGCILIVARRITLGKKLGT